MEYVTRAQQMDLMERSVVRVCRDVVLEGQLEITAAAFSKRIGRRYQNLVDSAGVAHHQRPSLRSSCLRRLIALTSSLPQDMRLVDALDSVFVGCIEYHTLRTWLLWPQRVWLDPEYHRKRQQPL